jgi:hypothetical protein
LNVFWYRYQCGYGLEDYREDSTHIWFIKWRCLVSLSIKHLYIRLDVAKIAIYHKAHTQVNGSFAHGEHDPESIYHMFRYAPRMSQALKGHIWAQPSLGYTTKQIYDKHKAIWWEHVNVGQNMTWNDFIQLQDIAYLDWKHKNGNWCLHTNPTISIQCWALQLPEDVFFFQNVGEINEIWVPFTIGIWTPTQCESMLSSGHSGAISMDATFVTKWPEIPSIHLDGVSWSLHGCPLSVWRTPKSRVEPTWGFNYVELRKVGTWKALPTSSTRKG